MKTKNYVHKVKMETIKKRYPSRRRNEKNNSNIFIGSGRDQEGFQVVHINDRIGE